MNALQDYGALFIATDTLNPDEPEQQACFTIDTPAKADWAVEKIKDARADRDRYVAVAQERIAEFEARIRARDVKLQAETAFLLGALQEYMDSTSPTRKAKTRHTLELPSGNIIHTLPSQSMRPDPDKLLAYAKAHAPQFVEQSEKVKWGEMKKQLSIAGEVVVDKQTGEVVDGVTVEQVPGMYEVK